MPSDRGARLAVLAGLGAFLVCASPTNGAWQGVESTNLRLSVKPEKTTCVLLEPVYLTVTLRNTASRPMAAEVSRLSIRSEMKIEIQEGDRDPIRYVAGPIEDYLGTPRHEFTPAGTPEDSMVEAVGLYHNDGAGELAFPRLGHYRILARVYLGNTPDPTYATAESAEIEVVEPGPEDVRLIEALGSRETLISILRGRLDAYCGAENPRQCFERLFTIAKQHTASSYAPAMMLGLRVSGPEVGRPFVDSLVLNEFLKRWPTHPMAPVARRYLDSY